jgi:hypothetical protein
MFQVWYSDPAVNQFDLARREGPLLALHQRQRRPDCGAQAAQRADQRQAAPRWMLEERKTIYAQALEISTSLATEIPTYQRKKCSSSNKDVINADTLFSGEDVTPFQNPTSYI